MRTRVGLLTGLLVATAHLPSASAQTPQGTSFTYQGRLTASSTPASGPYDLRFVLFDAPSGGASVGPTVALEDVTVTEGLFTVSLDFGSVFGGEKRWLELGVRPGSSTGPHTVIVPRQELTPSPSALFSRSAADALGLGGVPASQFVQTADPRLSDPRVPLPGSPDYVQNGTTPQSANFVVTGTGTANIFAAVTQFNLGPNRVLAAAGIANLFAGIGAGASTTGQRNTFVGSNAGQANTTGGGNTFFGTDAGSANTTAGGNSFFGNLAGRSNNAGGNSFFGNAAGSQTTTGINNAFFGDQAGVSNTTGQQNAIFGQAAGLVNNGSFNVFVGQAAGNNGTTGGNNTFVGFVAGSNNRTGSGNTFIGNQSSLETFDTPSTNNTLLGTNTLVAANLINATALGARAYVSQSNALVLGAVAGVNGSGFSTNVGIGTPAPAARLHLVDGASMVFGASVSCPNFVGIAFAPSIATFCVNYSLYGGDGNTYISRPPGGSVFFRENGVTQVLIRPGGVMSLQILGTGGSTALCRNPAGDVTTCSSSLRYKDDVASFDGGLDIVDRLRPISFTWKSSGRPDIGLAAEEVAEVEPLLAFRNDKGEIEGVNYSQLTVVLVNALRQQAARMQAEIEALKAVVCEARPQSAPCMESTQH